ncbi:peptide chain release factor H [Moheibacter stercoris]|uniref:Peptide chain release factor n=1 Tax=Moheibacter stercoris TaxID=1628251 RepID=A0ABV2LVV7_9FLAO
MSKRILQITAGRGPEECTWVVAQVLKILLDEANQLGLNPTMIHREVGNINGTVLSATVMLEGKNLQEFVDSWKGTIQWIGQSQFRKLHKRKNWFIGIFELESFQPVMFNEKDFEYQAMRSSGAGGQNVNKVNTAVRAIHKPSGLAVVTMDSRSQHQNKKLATERLLEKLNEENLKSIQNQIQTEWQNQTEVQRGNPTRIFKGSDFKKQKTEKNFKSERQKLKRDVGKNLED